MDKICPAKKKWFEVRFSSQLLYTTDSRSFSGYSRCAWKEISQSEFCCIGFNEKNDLSNTIQLSIFVIGVTNNFETVQYLLEQQQDILLKKLKEFFARFKIDPKKFCGMVTDGAAMVTAKKGFTEAFTDKLRFDNWYCG